MSCFTAFRWIVQYVDVFQDGNRELRVMGMLRDISDMKEKDTLQAGRLADLQRILDKTVEALGRTTEIRDPYTAGHQARTWRQGQVYPMPPVATKAR